MSDDPPPLKKRPYVCLDVAMPEKPTVAGLSDAAFRLFVEAMCYCGRNRTDGYMPKSILRRMGKPGAIRELEQACHIESADDATWHLIDYLCWNHSREEIEALTAAKSAGGTKGAHQKWHVAKRVRDKNCPLCYPVKGVG